MGHLAHRTDDPMIYLIFDPKASRPNMVKIGQSRNLERRLTLLRKIYQSDLRLLATVSLDSWRNELDVERMIHERYFAHRLYRSKYKSIPQSGWTEWFELNTEQQESVLFIARNTIPVRKVEEVYSQCNACGEYFIEGEIGETTISDEIHRKDPAGRPYKKYCHDCTQD